MINYIWFLIIGFGIIFGLFSGEGSTMSSAVITSASSSVQYIIGLSGILCFWCGIMKIAEKSGLTEKIAFILKPILRLLFKDASKSETALGAIVMNLTANMMGLSNAATPFGIKAMEELKKLSKDKSSASDDMALFLVLNAACIQFVPTTVLSIRAAAGARNPGDIILPAIFTTLTAAILGIVICKILQKFF